MCDGWPWSYKTVDKLLKQGTLLRASGRECRLTLLCRSRPRIIMSEMVGKRRPGLSKDFQYESQERFAKSNRPERRRVDCSQVFLKHLLGVQVFPHTR